MKYWTLTSFLLAALLLALAGEARDEDALDPAVIVSRSAGREPRIRLVIPGGLWHRVGTREDLRTIARRYYGSPRSWPTLAAVNHLQEEPEPGRLLWIPAQRPSLPDRLP